MALGRVAAAVCQVLGIQTQEGEGVASWGIHGQQRKDFHPLPCCFQIPWRREWQPTPVFLSGKSHGQRSLVGYSLWGWKDLDMTEHACIIIINNNCSQTAQVWIPVLWCMCGINSTVNETKIVILVIELWRSLSLGHPCKVPNISTVTCTQCLTVNKY